MVYFDNEFLLNFMNIPMFFPLVSRFFYVLVIYSLQKRTPTYFTGPDVAAEGSYFAYIEASEKPQGSQAIMQGHALEMSCECIISQELLTG